MLISEIYRSLQGEGLLTGKPSVFVRTSGCNLRCGFCDTPFTSWNPEGQNQTVDQVLKTVIEAADDAAHVVITGGEPMIQKEINELCQKIKSAGFHITIETAGTRYAGLDCDLMSISPKLSNSDPDKARAGEWRARHQSSRHCPEIVSRLISDYDYQLKFVVSSRDDLVEIKDYLAEVSPSSDRVLLMPEGVCQEELEAKKAWLEPLCLDEGFVFCARKHIEWYGNKRGT